MEIKIGIRLGCTRATIQRVYWWQWVLPWCQEIGLVAFMFFFELLFSYVSLTISFYVSFTNLFSIILFLIC